MGMMNHEGFAAPERPDLAQDQTVVIETTEAGVGGPASEDGPPLPDILDALPDMGAMLRRSIDQAEALFVQTACDLTRLAGRLDNGELDDLGEAVKQARALRAAASNLNEERNRVDKLRKEVGGSCGGAGSLDLDAARDEIGRRLACLRRAGGS